uniref:Uncharacterized protein n=1 Tax=Anguilla anguilla TaxID=7936 RepID=A0A0E9X8R1_ANGAN
MQFQCKVFDKTCTKLVRERQLLDGNNFHREKCCCETTPDAMTRRHARCVINRKRCSSGTYPKLQIHSP